MHISIPGHVFLNFSGTAQNWRAIVVPRHCPLPRGSSFLELDYWEETNHSEDLSNFIGASPKLDAKRMMHHHDDLSMLMVAPHGCIGWWSWSIFHEKKMSSISGLCLLPTKMISFISSPWLRWRRSRLSRWCNFITQLAMNQMFPRRRIDVGTKSISFVLIPKPSHNFVFSSPIILFVQLLTKYVVRLWLKTVWTKNPDGRSSPPFLFTLHIRFDWSQTL